MSYGYGGRPNPFDQRDDGGNGSYGGGGLPSRPNYGGGGRYDPAPSDEYGSTVEMASLAQNPGGFGSANSNDTLNEVSEINRGIDSIDSSLNQLKMMQQRALDDSDSSSSSNTNRQLDSITTNTMAQYRALTERVRQLKSNPDAQQRFGQQVRRVDTRLKTAMEQYRTVESQFRKRTQDQMARQYRIVRPDATDSEVRAAVEDDTGGQVFQQALMQSNRRGQAQAVLNAVQDRHAQLQKIEQQMTELTQLFIDLDTMVVQQDVAVANIEQKGEEVVENIDKGNVEIGTAVNTARATRKKKWICLGIVVAVLIIVAIIVAVYVSVNKPAGNAKRSILEPNGLSWFETEPVPQMLSARFAKEARRWIAEANGLPDA